MTKFKIDSTFNKEVNLMIPKLSQMTIDIYFQHQHVQQHYNKNQFSKKNEKKKP